MSRMIDADVLMNIYASRFELLVMRYGLDSAACGVLSGAMKLLEAQPTIEPQRQKGQWIEYIPEHGKCPFCGNQVDLLGGKANNFCGECDADMRGEQHDS